VRTVVRLGDGASTLLELESVDDVQFVVMSTHGRSGVRRWIRGSIAEAVLRRGRAPVVLVRRADTPAQATRLEHPGTGLRVLVPLDGSAFAAEALAEACRLATPSNGAIVLTMVVHPVSCKAEGSSGDVVPAAGAAPATAWRRDTAQPYLEEIAFTLCRRGLRATAVVLTATDPAAAIVDLATLEEIDLVVIATHGRGGLGRWRYGSVADAVSHRAPSPVLLVRPGAGSRWDAVIEATPGDIVVDRPAVLIAGRP
jgi:nucleotide-binding universal stress UspA family protein